MHCFRSPLVPFFLVMVCGMIGCDSAGTGGSPASDCAQGERLMGASCQSVPHLQVNVDERVDERNGGVRSGIGTNVCAFQASTALEQDRQGDCALFTFDGPTASAPFVGDAGVVGLFLQEPVLLQPDSELACYQSDLRPGREDLFAAGERFEVTALGGADFPAFDVEVQAPAALAMDNTAQVVRGEALQVEWLASSAEAVVLVINTYDEQTDQSAAIVCGFNDAAGRGSVAAELTAELLPERSEATLLLLRQNSVHVEPAGVSVAIDVLATTSVARQVILLDPVP